MKRARETRTVVEYSPPLGLLEPIELVFIDVMKGAEVFDRWDWTLLSHVCKTFRSLITAGNIQPTSLIEALVVLGTNAIFEDPYFDAYNVPKSIVPVWKAYVRRPRTTPLSDSWDMFLGIFDKRDEDVDEFFRWCQIHLAPAGATGFQQLLHGGYLSSVDIRYGSGNNLFAHITDKFHNFGSTHLASSLQDGTPTFLAQLQKLVRDENSLESLHMLSVLVDENRFDLVEKLVQFNPCVVPYFAAYDGPEIHACFFKHYKRGTVNADFVDLLLSQEHEDPGDLTWLRAMIQHEPVLVADRLHRFRQDHEQEADMRHENQSFEETLKPAIRTLLEEYHLLPQ
jgi:hypothetical protein